MNIRCLLSPRCYLFYYKQFSLLNKYKGRLTLRGYRLSYEANVNILIDEGAHLNFGRQIHLRKGVDLEVHDSASVEIGDHFFVNKNSSIVARYGIRIGSNCMIGENTTISDHNHVFDNVDEPFGRQGYRGKNIVIGDNVWIAGRVFIGQGVTIGDNVVIGANTVVTKSIPSNSVVYGKTELVVKPIAGHGGSDA